ncbi:MAG: MFS transporter [Desulfarculaceae bacterium]|nr:MFS transporter [Desulfarculaceae bacterium]MCF8048698.1 MFS transporter [Desulfarculaceae bacterium]MCF8064401.1 MFS transporter [Desulfarculaceae bacterium]MCF8098010.1 MFS transporter [Desulfarculaceae bacterium]MCF8122239.1 MFS transporter [Desulfarculaceae bacterium]
MNNLSFNAQTGGSSRAWAIYLVCICSYMLSMFYRVSVTVISPQLTADMGLSPSQLSDLSAAFFYAFAAAQIPLGLFLDRWGTRITITLLNLVAVAGALTFATAQGAGMATVGRVLLGVGVSGNMVGAMMLIAAWFPPRRFATLTGAVVGISTAGQFLAATPLVYISQAVGWRGAFVIVAVLNALVISVFYWVVRNTPPGVELPRVAQESPLKGLGQLFRRRYYWIIGVGTFFRYGCLMALQGLWAGPYLMNGLGLSQIQAGNILLFVTIGYMIGLPFWGRVSDEVLRTRKWVVLPALFIWAALVLSLGLMQGMPVWVLCALFFGLGLMSAPGQVMYPHIKELLPDHLAARALTGINLYTMLGAAALMQTAGFLVGGDPSSMQGIDGYWPVWLFMAGGLCLAGVLYLFIPDSKAIGEGQTVAEG